MGNSDRGDVTAGVTWLDANWKPAPALGRRAERIELLDGDGFVTRVERRIVSFGAKLTASATNDLRGFHSLDVTFRVRRPATEAIGVLDGADSIEWGPRHHPSRLSIRGRRPRRSGVRGPALVDAVLTGRRTGHLDLTIAVFDGNEGSCVVQLRRADRMPWGIRRRRRRMTATHEAADRLIERILAVDFRPPAPAAP